jgi:3-isopropylmalate dehydrogenase
LQAQELTVINPSILILAGDGIGPEVMAEVKKIILWFGERRGIHFDVSARIWLVDVPTTHGNPTS